MDSAGFIPIDDEGSRRPPKPSPAWACESQRGLILCRPTALTGATGVKWKSMADGTRAECQATCKTDPIIGIASGRAGDRWRAPILDIGT